MDWLSQNQEAIWAVVGLVAGWFLRSRAEWRKWLTIAHAEVDRLKAAQPNTPWLEIMDQAMDRIEALAGDVAPAALGKAVEKRAKEGP